MKENLEHLRKLYSDCDLSPSDIRKEKRFNKESNKEESFVLITRTGIEKIIAKKQICYNVDLVDVGAKHACRREREMGAAVYSWHTTDSR